MSKFWTILLHTYMNKLKSKSFIITTVLTAVIMLGLTNMENIANLFEDEDQVVNIAVLDDTGELHEAYAQNVTAISEKIAIQSFQGTEGEAEDQVKTGELTGYVLLSYTENELPQATYKAMSVTDSTIAATLQQSLQKLKETVATSQLGLDTNEIQQLYLPAKFEKMALQKSAKTEEELNQARTLVNLLIFLIYFAVIMYGSIIATEVATEKSSRVMEILISSVSPVKQMFGKIIGIGLLSLTQFAVILLIGYFSIKMNVEKGMQGGLFEELGFNAIPAATIIYAALFFMLGYFLYATLAAVLGSLVSRIEDVQQMITPMTLLIVAAFLIAVFGLQNPEGTFITVTSFIPFFTPIIMFLRVGMLNIPFWEIALGLAILIGTIIFLGVFGARVYRGGVLMYGKSSSFKDIKKALQLTKNE